MTRRYHDCPDCPACGSPAGTTWDSPRGDVTPPEHLRCGACGHVWEAGDEELIRARDADAAWKRKAERDEKRREKAAKADALRAKYEAAMAATRGTR